MAQKTLESKKISLRLGLENHWTAGLEKAAKPKKFKSEKDKSDVDLATEKAEKDRADSVRGAQDALYPVALGFCRLLVDRSATAGENLYEAIDHVASSVKIVIDGVRTEATARYEQAIKAAKKNS